MDETDDTLITRAREGDDDALLMLLTRYGPEVRQGLAGQMPQRWQALLAEDDVMQQTYVDAFRDVRHLDGSQERAFPRWLSTLAKRNLLDAIRMLEADKRGGGRQPIDGRSRDESFAALHEVVAATSTTPSRVAAHDEAVGHLEKAVASLPPDYRMVIEQYDLGDRPIEEIANELGRSVGAVYMLRARAHRLLGDLMGSGSRFFTSS